MSKLPKFLKDLISSLNSNGDGHSLKKILSLCFFILIAYVTIKYTTVDNLVMVLTIHSSCLTALLGISTYHELKTRDPGDSTDNTIITQPDAPIPNK